MGKYIHLFQSTEEFNQAINNNFTKPWVSYTKENDKVDYYKSKYEHKCEQYFTIEATEDETLVYFRQSSYAVDGGLDPLKVEVSKNGGKTWLEVTAAPSEDNVPGAILTGLDEGEKVLIRGRNEAYGLYDKIRAGDIVDNCNFYADKPCYVYGNIMSLIGGDNFVKFRKVNEYAFACFFTDYDEKLDWSWVLSKEGEELLLPATTLADSCYNCMFNGCTGLTSAPALPAMTLAQSCYGYMFNGCAGLVVAPALPATVLADWCYNNMFQNCIGLTVAPKLPATTLALNCYSGMFRNCTSLTTVFELPAMTLAQSCYYSMFQGCTSLTVAPELPATTLTSRCYDGMFYDCMSLISAPELPATTLAYNCYDGMFYGCTSLTTAPELPATTLAENCYNSMFQGCTGLTSAPELPATTLASSCYSSMFYGCTNLAYIKAMFTTTPGGSYTTNWVKNVKGTGTFVKNSAATWDVTGNNGVPTGWTVETADA